MNVTEYPYDLTNATNVDNIYEFVQQVNFMTGETFMAGILFAGFIVLFIALKSKNVDNRDALSATLFIITVMTMFFYMLDFISGGILIILIIALGLLFVYLIFKKT